MRCQTAANINRKLLWLNGFEIKLNLIIRINKTESQSSLILKHSIVQIFIAIKPISVIGLKFALDIFHLCKQHHNKKHKTEAKKKHH